MDTALADSTVLPGPRSLDLMARKENAVATGVGTAMPTFASSAQAGVIIDVDGNRLIDLTSGIAVTSLGNAFPRVTEAVKAQIDAFTHTCFMVTPYESYVAVAETLNRITPGTHDKRTALFNSGAEAIENAVKIARTYTGRSTIAVFDHGYHGRTNLTMAMTANAAPYKKGFGPFAPDIARVSGSYPFRDGSDQDPVAAARRTTAMLERQIGVSDLAGIVVEPIQGEGGFIVPAPGYLSAVEAWCRDNDVLFIMDEVQTGFARTGNMFAAEHEGVTPDIVALAKGVANGMPLSAVTGRADVMNAVHSGGLGGTYGGNPVACAAALATIHELETGPWLARAVEIEGILRGRLQALQATDRRIADIRGRGAMIAAELVHANTHEPHAELARTVTAAAHSKGVAVITCGSYGNVLRFLPPLTITDELLDEAFDILGEVFRTSS